MKLTLVLLILTATTPAAFADGTHSLFAAGKHCVAYKVKKRWLSLFSGTAIGQNCDISVQLLPEVGGGYQVEVNIPVRSFDSGDHNWDQDMRTVLRESEQPDILFRSKVMSDKEWREAILKPSVKIEGELVIGNKSYPIATTAQITKVGAGIEIDGVAVEPFAKFNLRPPKEGGGLIAKADSDVELHFHLVSEKILGADKLLAPPEKEKDIISEAMQKIDDSPEPQPSPTPAATLKLPISVRPTPPMDTPEPMKAESAKPAVKAAPANPPDPDKENL